MNRNNSYCDSDSWQLIHSDGELVDLDDDTSSISSDWSVMNIQEVEGPEGDINASTADGQLLTSLTGSTATLNAGAIIQASPQPVSTLPPRRRQRRRHRGRAVRQVAETPSHAPVRASSLAVRQALAPVAPALSVDVVNTHLSNRAALQAKAAAERRFLRNGGEISARAQQNHKHTKYLFGQGKRPCANQRSHVRVA